jgi:hypothetical protein
MIHPDWNMVERILSKLDLLCKTKDFLDFGVLRRGITGGLMRQINDQEYEEIKQMLIDLEMIRTKRGRWKARKPGVFIDGRRYMGTRVIITWSPKDMTEITAVQEWFEHHVHFSIAGIEKCPTTERDHLYICVILERETDHSLLCEE